LVHDVLFGRSPFFLETLGGGIQTFPEEVVRLVEDLAALQVLLVFLR